MVSMLQLRIVGTNKINILSYLVNNNFYSKDTFNEYKYLFDIFLKNKNFNNHGNQDKWLNILKSLPNIKTKHLDFSGSQIVIGKPDEINIKEMQILENELLKLCPWRKGPFNIFGLEIDSEWRSEKKWERIKNYLPNTKGMRIGDLGCSNGYYAYKLLGLSPELIIGMDKTALFIIQFLSIKYYTKQIQELLVLPCSAEEFSKENFDFDLLLSMGILYHAKNPESHLGELNKLLKKSGYLVIETIVSMAQENINIDKGQKYAGMKNIGTIFTKNHLIDLLKKYQFKNIECVDESYTTPEEQRATKWMEGKSFQDFLSPNGNTIEGYPPVCRAIFMAQKK